MPNDVINLLDPVEFQNLELGSWFSYQGQTFRKIIAGGLQRGVNQSTFSADTIPAGAMVQPLIDPGQPAALTPVEFGSLGIGDLFTVGGATYPGTSDLVLYQRVGASPENATVFQDGTLVTFAPTDMVTLAPGAYVIGQSP